MCYYCFRADSKPAGAERNRLTILHCNVLWTRTDCNRDACYLTLTQDPKLILFFLPEFQGDSYTETHAVATILYTLHLYLPLSQIYELLQ